MKGHARGGTTITVATLCQLHGTDQERGIPTETKRQKKRQKEGGTGHREGSITKKRNRRRALKGEDVSLPVAPVWAPARRSHVAAMSVLEIDDQRLHLPPVQGPRGVSARRHLVSLFLCFLFAEEVVLVFTVLIVQEGLCMRSTLKYAAKVFQIP